jgi:MoxR-like ATPase
MEGTYPLPEAQLDRFLFKIDVPFPDLHELSQIIDRTTGTGRQRVEPVMSGEELLGLREVVRAVPVAEPVKLYALRLILGSHPEREDSPEFVRRFVQYGASPRGAQAVILGAKVHALLSGRGQVDYEDVRATVRPALRHRLLLNFEGQAEGMTPDKLVARLLEAVPDVDPKLRAEARR